jgi:predicted DNA-binding transcriptional regulator AlpA
MASNDDPLITPAGAAEILQRSPSTLAYWRCNGLGPQHVKMGKAVFYRRSDLQAYIETCLRTSTHEAAHAA